MSNLKMIQNLCELLDMAANIIREQAEIMAQHDIRTDDGGLEQRRDELLEMIEKNW